MTTAFLVLARAIHIGSAMLLVALPFFVLFVSRPFLTVQAVESHAAFCKKMMRWLWLALILEALSGVAWFWLVAAQMSDQSPWQLMDSADLNAVLAQTQFGQLWVARAVMGLILGVLLSLVGWNESLARPGIARVNWLLLAASACLLISLSWAGHAASGIHYHILHLVADSLHLLLGSIWPTGLIPLAAFLRQSRHRNCIGPDDFAIKVLYRFSQLSLFAVLLLLTTGFINGCLMIGSWSGLFSTPYGFLLLAKVGVVGFMISLGALNRFYFLPRLQGSTILFRGLHRAVLIESGLALLILLLVAILGTTSPPS